MSSEWNDKHSTSQPQSMTTLQSTNHWPLMLILGTRETFFWIFLLYWDKTATGFWFVIFLRPPKNEPGTRFTKTHCASNELISYFENF